MEYRSLGSSGLQVPVLCLGTGTFAGRGEFFKRWGNTDVAGATRLVDICLEAGLNFFDTADMYSGGGAEEVLGQAIAGRRDKVLVTTKATLPTGTGPNERGSSRHYLLRACEASLRRLRTDYIDVYLMHAPDLLTPVEETLGALEDLVRAGKVRYIGCSNYSGWHAMKALAHSAQHGIARFVTYQGYYSLIGRDYESELMPLALDQGLGTMVWSPLGWGRLTGKLRRGQPPAPGRIQAGGEAGGPVVEQEYLYRVIDAIEVVAAEVGKSVPQVALNWLLGRPSVSTLVIGARDEAQLRQNIAAVGWRLSADQVARLDAASATVPPYPYWHHRDYQGPLSIAVGRGIGGLGCIHWIFTIIYLIRSTNCS